jgi:hypothetical protein
MVYMMCQISASGETLAFVVVGGNLVSGGELLGIYWLGIHISALVWCKGVGFEVGLIIKMGSRVYGFEGGGTSVFSTQFPYMIRVAKL